MTEPGGLVTPRAAPETRRAARAMREETHRRARTEPLTAETSTSRHARPRLPRRLALVAGLTVAAALLLGSSATVTAMMIGTEPDTGSPAAAALGMEAREIEQLPVPDVDQSAAAADICTLAGVSAAVHAGDDEGAVAAAGGGEAFRAAVVEGRAPCIDLADPSRLWAVIDKLRPVSPLEFRPAGLALPEGVRNIEGSPLRANAASAFSSLVAAARDAGVGEIALESAYRSYESQQQTYRRHVAERGEQADMVSARPGYSEHQLGLAADIVPCAGACSTLDGLAASAQGDWIAEHAWEHGWIVRYVDGATAVTGYTPEPWHLRYVGPELAKAYHEGGWTSLEEFFGLPPAPGYAG